MKNFSLYIHIPFCKTKCHYCDFTSFKCNETTMDTYVNSLIRELSLYKEKLKNHSISTIFIGGGTPSSIDAKYIEKILNFVYENYNIDSLKEVSIETNPGTLDKYKVKKYKAMGINRVSLGVQSLNDDMLKSIGRSHKAEDVYRSLSLLREEGFKNLNADLMFSLPGQTMDDIEYTLSEIIKMDFEHISLYSLIIEENTPFGVLYKQGKIQPISEDLDRNMYHRSIEILKSAGYDHYEISNFAKDNKECLHNLAYWTIKPYLGVGLSSHSNMFSKRFFNYSDRDRYNESLRGNVLPIEGEEFIGRETLIGEYMIMGLRLIKGVDKDDYKDSFNEDIHSRYGHIIKKHKDNGLIKENDNHIALTQKGLDLSNIVELDFFNLN